MLLHTFCKVVYIIHKLISVKDDQEASELDTKKQLNWSPERLRSYTVQTESSCEALQKSEEPRPPPPPPTHTHTQSQKYLYIIQFKLAKQILRIARTQEEGKDFGKVSNETN